MNPAPNLVLVGPMGAGKSSIGKRLSTRLGLEFVDADQLIEQRAGARVPMLFELEGEPAFRAREESLLGELLQGQERVIATGGGAVLSAASRERMRRRAFVVYLKLGVDGQLQRLARDSNRPLLAGGDRRQTLQALARVRNPLYEEVADMVFAADGLAVGAATSRLHELVQSQWRREAAA